MLYEKRFAIYKSQRKSITAKQLRRLQKKLNIRFKEEGINQQIKRWN